MSTHFKWTDGGVLKGGEMVTWSHSPAAPAEITVKQVSHVLLTLCLTVTVFIVVFQTYS